MGIRVLLSHKTIYKYDRLPTQWMVRRWKPPLTEEKPNPYLTGGMLAPYPQYVGALITGNFTGSGEAIKAAIARNSWA